MRETPRQDSQIDRWIDSALEHAKAEPRAGLEERVIARLHERETRPRWGMLFVPGIIAACVLMVASVALLNTHRRPGTPAAGRATARIFPSQPEPRGAPVTNSRLPIFNKGARRRTTESKRSNRASTPDALPKLAQFPAPLHVSQDLARFVALSDTGALQKPAVDSQPSGPPEEIKIAPLEIAALQQD